MKVGTYYYPEQWPRSQWKRDFDQMAAMKLQLVHMAEFAWHTMEPREEDIQLDWLSECVELAVERKMGVILCTPTAAPPIWLTAKYPEVLLVDQNGTSVRAGGRRHYSPTSKVYIDHCRRIVYAMVQRFGHNPSVVGWQIDNEYSGPWDQHDYTHEAFRHWLQNKYKSIEQLNNAWGCQFWNTFYDDWDQILLPPCRPLQYDNPHHHLDGARFWSWAWANFNRQQADIIHDGIKGNRSKPFVTTNFMPFHLDANPDDMRDDLDLYSWDAYPVSGQGRGMTDETYRMGDPDQLAFTHDQMASYTGRWGQMELQPGHVNWSGYPSLLYPGVVRLWIWTAFAHCAEFVTTYRFRQPLFGTELFHSGLVDTTGTTPSLAGREFTEAIEEFERLEPAKLEGKSESAVEVGLVFDFDQLWNYDILPQARRWNQPAWLLSWYRALARLGLRIKVLQANQPWPTDLPMIVAPGLQMIDDHLMSQMNEYVKSGGNLLLTCRTGWMNRQGQLFEGPIAQPILKLIGGLIEAYDSMPEQTTGQIEMDNEKYSWSVWGELLYNEPRTKILAKYSDQFYDDVPAIIQNKIDSGTVTYCGVVPEQKLVNALVVKLATQFKLPASPLPDRVHVVRRGKYDILLNYQDKPVSAPAPKDAKFVIGAPKVDPAGIAVWEIE
ncbi:MAG TPA: beta-galactosidase [Tepidisphaeraceae bacterium]|nr:beta-galactosidase [Tepidisphaeraceae bacterium]